MKSNRVLTSKESQDVDKYTIEELGVMSYVLMERAAISVCDCISRHIHSIERIIVVCGCGNNGGDGLAVARILSTRGYDVHVYLCESDGSKGSEGYQYQKKLLQYYNVPVETDLKGYDCVIDAIFGIGLSREISGKYYEIIDTINHMDNVVRVAVDCPSGVDCDNAKILGIAVKCDYTVTFGSMKKGLALYPGAEYAGKVYVSDIGFPELAYEKCCTEKIYMTCKDTLNCMNRRIDYSNKGTYGRALIIAGSRNMCGAAVMAAKACYNTGAGLVKVVTCEENRNIIQTLVPEAILTTYNEFNADILSREIMWADVILAGPGLSTCETAVKIVDSILESDKPVVLDADAINIIAANREMLDKCNGKNIIITPHLGEMSRLCGMSIEQIREDLIAVCRNFAHKYNIVCVLKDARTIVSDGYEATINMSGNSGMAKGGSGDALAGIITGILLQKNGNYNSAVLGTYLHGLAGDEAAKKLGRYSMSPLNLIENISVITKQMEADL